MFPSAVQHVCVHVQVGRVLKVRFFSRLMVCRLKLVFNNLVFWPLLAVGQRDSEERQVSRFSLGGKGVLACSSPTQLSPLVMWLDELWRCTLSQQLLSSLGVDFLCWRSFPLRLSPAQ